jgi:hypothetical protein
MDISRKIEDWKTQSSMDGRIPGCCGREMSRRTVGG